MANIEDKKIKKYISDYVKSINKTYQAGNYTEYSFRSALKVFLTKLMNELYTDDYRIQEEHSHYKNIGNYKGKLKNAPDYTIYKNGLQTGVIETKRPEKSLTDRHYQNQFTRYKKAFSYSIFTNYLTFHGWKRTKQDDILDIATTGVNNNQNGIIIAKNALKNAKKLAADISLANIQPIKSSRELAIVTANLSKMLSDSVLHALNFYEYKRKHGETIPNSLTTLYLNFKSALIKDIAPEEFSHLFAQTITYGMIIARVSNPSGKFTRDTAVKDTPSTDPFLKEFFTSVMGKNIDNKIKWTVDRLTTAFSVTDIHCLIKGFRGYNPLINFYELFLKEFDNKMRKNLGVWYTPKEIAKFIVYSVNYLLKTELQLPNGLTSGLDQNDNMSVIINNRTKKEPKVQILDPAVGTGTFLVEALKLIYHTVKQKSNIAGIWHKYVKDNLIYQLNAFEILMAAYTVTHLRLYITLRNTFNGKMPKDLGRFHVFLTNALMNPINSKGINFLSSYVAKEELASNKVKDKSPIMVIIGNPPYRRKSQNKGCDVNKLMKPYVKGLPNKNQIAVHDDCVKFIRLAESYIEKRKLGIIGYITNSSYLRAKSCWKMRRHLASVFDDIYIINLNGGKHEQPDSSEKRDENVFNIKIPVAISIFVKKSKNRVFYDDNHLATIHYMNITGKRIFKLNILNNNSIKDFIKRGDFNSWVCNPKNKWSFIYEGDIAHNPYYNKFISVDKIFHNDTEGIVTGNDTLLLNHQDRSQQVLNDLKNDTENVFSSKYKKQIHKNWVSTAMKEIKALNDFKVTKIQYHPLMYAYIPYSPLAKSNKVLRRPRNPVINEMIKGSHTLGLVVPSGINNSMSKFNHALVSNTLIVNRIFKGDRSGGFIFPLKKKPLLRHFCGNFNTRFFENFNKSINKPLNIHSYSNCKSILSWIIAILNAPQFIDKYNNNLKDNYPRVPYPKDYKQFKQVSSIGNKLIKAFTVNYSDQELSTCPYELCGKNDTDDWTVDHNILSKNYYNKNKHELFINNNYYFNNVNNNQLQFQLGGYHLIHQWLHDNLGHSLTIEEIKSMQGMLISISEIINLRNKLKFIKSIKKF